jgi:hypothetical protein
VESELREEKQHKRSTHISTSRKDPYNTIRQPTKAFNRRKKIVAKTSLRTYKAMAVLNPA